MLSVGHAMAEAFTHWSATVEAGDQSYISPYCVFGGKSCIGIGFSSSTSVTPVSVIP